MSEEAAQPGVKANASGRKSSCDELARRRQINRESMRRRRADPVRWAQDQERRKNSGSASSDSAARGPSITAKPAQRICALCHQRPAVEDVTRLEPSRTATGGYAKVRLPYCGRC
ncbi:MAG: hypothetical protein WA192_02355 [Candidatus Acidiferrales bacterium]